MRTLIAGVHTTPSRRLCFAAALTMASLTDVMSVMSMAPASAWPPALAIIAAVAGRAVGVHVEATDVRALLRRTDGDGLADAGARADDGNGLTSRLKRDLPYES